jgi:hypothetical protein
MSRMTLAFLVVVAFAYVMETDCIGIRKFSKAVVSSNGRCTGETRTSGLNCSCPLGNQRQRCSFSSNSQCINNKCVCTGSDYPDCATGIFCRVRFRMTAPTVSFCWNTTSTTTIGVPSSTTLNFAGQPRQPVTCTVVVGTATGLTFITPANMAASSFFVSSSGKVTLYNSGLTSVVAAANTNGTQPVTFTCTDACGISATGTMNIFWSSTTAPTATTFPC